MATSSDDPDALVASAKAHPGDEALYERAARALTAAARHAEAVALLRGRFKVLNRKAMGPAPSLYKDDLDPALAAWEVEGLSLVRDFVVAHDRVLFFWRPRELDPKAETIRDAMRARLLGRLKPSLGGDPTGNQDE